MDFWPDFWILFTLGSLSYKESSLLSFGHFYVNMRVFWLNNTNLLQNRQDCIANFKNQLPSTTMNFWHEFLDILYLLKFSFQQIKSLIIWTFLHQDENILVNNTNLSENGHDCIANFKNQLPSMRMDFLPDSWIYHILENLIFIELSLWSFGHSYIKTRMFWWNNVICQ